MPQPSPRPRFRRFRDYELLSEIGLGGMGVVFRARQVSLDRLVAVKMIRAGALATETDIKRFQREAQAAAGLDHPNIVAVYEVGAHQGQHYLSMRLVEGHDLAEAMAEKRWPIDNARKTARLMVIVTRAVHHAHQRRILHRDLKPSNIMLDAKGEPHVTDFGLARRIDVPSGMTVDGTLLGTPGFMSPEQAEGRSDRLTTATDVYGLGALLYFLLTGRAPFKGSTLIETLQMVKENEPTRPTVINSRADPDLETICLKCLEKDPQRRYGSAEALAEDLERWLRDEPILARRSSTWEHVVKWARRKPAVAALIGLVMLVTALGFAVSLWYAHDAREKLRQAYYAQARANRWSGRPGRRFDGLDALTKAAAIRPSLELRNEAIACLALADVRVQRSWRLEPPSAKWIGTVFDATLERYATAEQDGSIRICQSRDDRVLFRLPGPGKPDSVVLRFGPDGRFLAGRYLGAEISWLHVWDLSRRKLVLSESDRGYAFDFSPDSGQIAVADSTGSIHFHSLPEGTELRVLDLSSPQCLLSYDPSGKRLAACGCQRSNVQILDVNSGRIEREFNHPAVPGGLAWSPDGRLLGCACYDAGIYLWEVASGRTNAVLRLPSPGAGTVAFNRSGDGLVSYGPDGFTRFWDLNTARESVSISGEWASIAFGSNDRQLGFKVYNVEVGLWEVEPAPECRQLGVVGPLMAAQFNRDGSLLATASRDGVRLWSVKANRLLGHLPAQGCRSALFHPDGESLIVSGWSGLQRWPLRSMKPAEEMQLGPVEQLWSGSRESAALSPDGHTVVATGGAHSDLVVIDLRGGEVSRLLQGHPMASYVSISPDQKWFATGTWKGTGVKVWATQTWQPIQELPADGNAICNFSPDGQWLATSSGKECRFWKAPQWEAGMVMPRDRAGDLPGMMAFSPDGRMLAYLYGRRSGVRLISVPEGRELATLDTGNPLCFSPDGSQLATMEDNQQVLLIWDLRLIRQRLATMKLDWDLPPLPPSNPSPERTKLTVTVDPEKSDPPLDLISILARDPQTATNLIDLSPHYNAGFEGNWHNLDPREAGNDLAWLPTGVQTFAGVPFDVRGLIQVGAQIGIQFPREVRGIVVGRPCRRLHFLHSAVHADRVPNGTAIGRYVVHFATGDPISVPIVIGQDVANWWEPPAGTEPPLVLAWQGTNAAGHRVRLFKTTWENPRPAETVESIDLLGDRDRAAPFLVAITVE